MREAEEIKRLRLAEPARLPPGGVPPELDQARLARVQSQGELREPLAKVRQEPLRVTLMLKARDEVIRLCRLRDYAERGVKVLARALPRASGAA